MAGRRRRSATAGSDALGALRADAERVLRAAVAGAAPGPPVAAALERAPELQEAARVLVLAFGKAAVEMAAAATRLLGDRVAGGLIVAPHGTTPRPDSGLPFLTAAHPLPDTHSIVAAHAVRDLVASAGAGDLLLALISGGGSALLTDPVPGVTLADVVSTTRALLHAGADIHTLNTARRRIDRVKGGRLAALAMPARVLCLAVSDVPGDDPAIIASGPFTPDADQPPAANVRYQIVASNTHAIRAALAAAESLGYRPAPGAFRLDGEARRCGERLAAAALDLTGREARIYGGETTVTVRGSGRGGRNQEVALAAAVGIAGAPGVVVGTLGTDGGDGNSPAAGAIVDGTSAARLAAAGREGSAALADNDSYTALQAIGDVLVTGPTGTNVMDVGVVLRS